MRRGWRDCWEVWGEMGDGLLVCVAGNGDGEECDAEGGMMLYNARKPFEWPTAMSVAESQHMHVHMLFLRGRMVHAAESTLR